MPKILHYIIYIMNHDDILTYEKLVAAVLFWYLLLYYRGIAWWLHYEDRGIKNKYLSTYFIENIQKYKP